jgi:ubiquitin carboxyl-terminal hydrolase 5/13
MDALLPIIRSHCVSFDSPFSDAGLYVNLVTFMGFGGDFWRADAAKTGCSLYLHEVWKQVPKASAAGDAPVTKLAIGVQGGFAGGMGSDYDVDKHHELVVLTPTGDAVAVALPTQDLPDLVSSVVEAVIKHSGMKVPNTNTYTYIPPYEQNPNKPPLKLILSHTANVLYHSMMIAATAP